MPNIDYQLVLITLTALGFGIAFSYSVRGILYHTPDTDNELMAYAAAQSHKWRWFSDLHKMGKGKTGMKDVTIILISVMQRILRNKTGDYPYTVLGGITNAISAFLIFLIATEYLGPVVALFLGILFLVSFWNWQIALHGGHANVATMFFLLSVLSVQQINNGFLMPAVWLIITGAIFCLSQFASASSIKYTPLFFVSVFYARYHDLIKSGGWSSIYASIWNNRLYGFNVTIIALFLAGIILLKINYKKIVASIYHRKAPAFLNKIISGRELFPLDYYIKHAKKRVRQLTIWGLWLIIGLLLLLNVIGFYYLITIAIGLTLGFLILNLPDIKKGFRYYLDFLLETQVRKKSHFRVYVDYFAKKGLTVSRYTQGAGLVWLPRVFFRMIPFHTIIFVVAAAGSIVSLFMFPGDLWINFVNIVLLLIFSLSPIIWAEMTRAPQLSRTYSPGLVGMLLTIGYGAYLVQIAFPGNYIIIFSITLTATSAWNLWKFFSDVYPARMGATKLFSVLKRLSIKEIYTYDTKYNRALVETIPGLGESEYTPRKKIEPPFAVHYINSITDVRDGWIVIPGTNGRALTMDATEAINNNFRFTKDPVLNKLIESHDIEKMATAKIKTCGASRIWPLESEVLGYMDLILHEIKPEDIYRGYAWLIHSSKLRNFNSNLK